MQVGHSVPGPIAGGPTVAAAGLPAGGRIALPLDAFPSGGHHRANARSHRCDKCYSHQTTLLNLAMRMPGEDAIC